MQQRSTGYRGIEDAHRQLLPLRIAILAVPSLQNEILCPLLTKVLV
jgi:hypothetical protein